MPITDIYSKRQKKLRGETPDVYQYDRLPDELKFRIIEIMYDVLGDYDVPEERPIAITDTDFDPDLMSASWYFNHVIFDSITNLLCREYGKSRLETDDYESETYSAGLLKYFFYVEDIEKNLDVIELFFRVFDPDIPDIRNSSYMKKKVALESPDLIIFNLAIQELNERFKEHGIGYYYANGWIICVNDEFIHSEIVRPALGILNRKEYAGAQQEFLRAHEHYRAGRTKEALNECLKSLESMMKSICDKRRWNYDQGDSANRLIGICLNNGIIPPFWQSHFTALRSLLESGVPPARNKLGGHGQGAAPKPVPSHIASYVLHMTAAAIVFLAEADGAGA